MFASLAGGDIDLLVEAMLPVKAKKGFIVMKQGGSTESTCQKILLLYPNFKMQVMQGTISTLSNLVSFKF